MTKSTWTASNCGLCKTIIHHLDTRKQCFSAEKRTKIADFRPSEKVQIQQKSLTSSLGAWTIHRPIYQLHCVKIWRRLTQREPRYSNFCVPGLDLMKNLTFWIFRLVDTRTCRPLSDRPSAALCPCRVPRNPYQSRGLSKILHFQSTQWSAASPANTSKTPRDPGTCLQP